MRYIMIGLFISLCMSKIMYGQGVINEFHYDNADGDEGEFVEVFWPMPDSQPVSLANYRIFLYNGADSMTNGDRGLQDILTTCDSAGCYYVWETGLQNSLEGIALAYTGDEDTLLYDFISYEGAILALDGPAEGMLSYDVEVEEGNDTPLGYSLQRKNDTTWFAGPETRGVVNPIELGFFSAIYRDREDGVLITWNTLSENNNSYFEVQRSRDGHSFNLIANIEGAGNSQQILEYQYMDVNVEEGTYFYRLKQVDHDGSFSYSSVVRITIQDRRSKNNLQPVLDNNYISFTGKASAEKFDFYLYSLEGRLLLTRPDLSNGETIRTTTNIPPVCIYAIKTGEKVSSGKLVGLK